MSNLHMNISVFVSPEIPIQVKASAAADGGAVIVMGNGEGTITLFIGHRSDVEGLRVLLELENAILVARDLLTKRVNESYNVTERGRYSMSSVQVIGDDEYEAAYGADADIAAGAEIDQAVESTGHLPV